MLYQNHQHLTSSSHQASHDDSPTNPTDNHLHRLSHNNSRPRILIFCHCYDPTDKKNLFNLFSSPGLSTGVQKIKHLMNAIDVHVFTYIQGASITHNTTCEEEVVSLIEKPRHQGTLPLAVEVFYNSGYEECTLPKQISYTYSSPHDNSWVGGAHLVDEQRVVLPINVQDWGEVFTVNKDRHTCDSSLSTLNIFRSKSLNPHQEENCNLIHVPTILSWAALINQRRNQLNHLNETLGEMLTRRLTYKEAKEVLEKKTKFCSLITFTTWKEVYSIDAMVRHALCRLLTQKYKPCEGLREWTGDMKGIEKTGPDTTFRVQRDYKFVIAMANEFSDGYFVEKTVNPYVANSIAISASPSLRKYMNGNRPVICNISRTRLDYVGQWARGGAWMPFNTTPDDWKKDDSIQPIPFDLNHDQPLLKFVSEQWEDDLQPCVDEIIRLDKDDESYIRKLMEPFILRYEGSIFDGTYVGIALLHWLVQRGSLVTHGLEQEIWRMAMPKQTE